MGVNITNHYHYALITKQYCLDVNVNTALIENKNIWLNLQLQEVFSTYKKERVESDKALMEQNEKLQEQISDLRSQNAKVSTQLEFASKR